MYVYIIILARSFGDFLSFVGENLYYVCMYVPKGVIDMEMERYEGGQGGKEGAKRETR